MNMSMLNNGKYYLRRYFAANLLLKYEIENHCLQDAAGHNFLLAKTDQPLHWI